MQMAISVWIKEEDHEEPCCLSPSNVAEFAAMRVNMLVCLTVIDGYAQKTQT